MEEKLKELEPLLHDVLREGFEITFKNCGDGVLISVRAHGAVTYGAIAQGGRADLNQVLFAAAKDLRQGLSKR